MTARDRYPHPDDWTVDDSYDLLDALDQAEADADRWDRAFTEPGDPGPWMAGMRRAKAAHDEAVAQR